MFYAAIDLGGTKIAGPLGRADGTLVAGRAIPTEADGGSDHVMARIVSLVREFGGSPLAHGIGVPGLVDRSRGDAESASQWRRIPLRPLGPEHAGRHAWHRASAAGLSLLEGSAWGLSVPRENSAIK